MFKSSVGRARDVEQHTFRSFSHLTTKLLEPRDHSSKLVPTSLFHATTSLDTSSSNSATGKHQDLLHTYSKPTIMVSARQWPRTSPRASRKAMEGR